MLKTNISSHKANFYTDGFFRKCWFQDLLNYTLVLLNCFFFFGWTNVIYCYQSVFGEPSIKLLDAISFVSYVIPGHSYKERSTICWSIPVSTTGGVLPSSLTSLMHIACLKTTLTTRPPFYTDRFLVLVSRSAWIARFKSQQIWFVWFLWLWIAPCFLFNIESLKHQMGKNSLVMDTFATCFVIFRLNPERYKYKLFINKVTYMDLIITQSLWFILLLVPFWIKSENDKICCKSVHH